MNIALIGASGYVGAQLLNEALARGHKVTALVRNPGKLPAHEKLRAVAADVYDSAALAEQLRGHDAVLSAFSPGAEHPDARALHTRGSQSILDAVQTAGVRRLLVIGGAGSLYVAPGVQAVDTPEFPAAWKEGALGAREALNQLRGNTALDWTFLSPPALLEPGTRSGKYRLGQDQLLMDGEHPARISVQDLAVVALDELEQGRHLQQRFTAAN